MEQNKAYDKVHHGKVRMIPVTLQIFFLVLPFLLAGGIFMWRQSRKMFDEERLEFAQTLLLQAAILEAGQLDGEKFGTDSADDAYFKDRIRKMREETWLEIEGMSREEGEEDYRTELLYGYFGRKGEKICCLMDMGTGNGQELEWVSQCIENREAVSASYGKEEKNYLALYVPVFSSSGVAGAVKCSLVTEKFFAGSKELARVISRQVIWGFSVIVLIIMGMLAIFLRPIRQLKFFLQEVGETGKAMHLHGRGLNEVSELLEILSRMSENIHEYMSEVRRLQEKYLAFIPNELVALLGKSDIREVKAGDFALCEGTLAVINMGDFSQVRMGCHAEELFERINLGLAQMIPEIEKNHGQILRFIQGGLLAFFPGEGEAAVVCVDRILQKLQAKTTAPYYAAMDYRKIRLEVAGDETRLQFTVRGKDGEDILRLFKLAQKHGLAMVGGEGLQKKLNDEGSRVFVRSLGQVYCTKEQETMEIIELSAEKKEHPIRLREETAELFDRGIYEFQSGHFRESRECFAEILRKNHEDRAAQRYFILCDHQLCGEDKGMEVYFDCL